MMGTMTLILESREVIRIEPAFPTVKGLRRYIEMAAGQSRVPVLGVREIIFFGSLPSCVG